MGKLTVVWRMRKRPYRATARNSASEHAAFLWRTQTVVTASSSFRMLQ
jgi:hypothetical protein